MKRLFITMFDSEHSEIFSDFIEHIDSVNSHTVIYKKTKFSEADVIRLPFNVACWSIGDGQVNIYYDNGLYCEIIRK